MSRPIVLQNSTDTLLCVWLEPWGEDYWLKPEMTIEVAQEDGSTEGDLSVDYEEGAVIIWVNKGDYPRVTIDGEARECGFGRPRDAT